MNKNICIGASVIILCVTLWGGGYWMGTQIGFEESQLAVERAKLDQISRDLENSRKLVAEIQTIMETRQRDTAVTNKKWLKIYDPETGMETYHYPESFQKWQTLTRKEQ